MNTELESKIEQEWTQRGFSFGVWIDPPGQEWRNYRHPVDELLMVVEGELEVEIDGVKYRPKPGEELFIPAGAVHSVRNIGRSTARWLYGYRRS